VLCALFAPVLLMRWAMNSLLLLAGIVKVLAFSAEPTIFTDAFNLLLLLGLLV
jgi:hypothetical protein